MMAWGFIVLGAVIFAAGVTGFLSTFSRGGHASSVRGSRGLSGRSSLIKMNPHLRQVFREYFPESHPMTKVQRNALRMI